MEREKGATTTDKSAHRLFDSKIQNRLVIAICHNCGGPLRTSYHEERLYSVRCNKCKTVTLVKAGNPCAAAEKVGIVARPAEEWHEDYGDALWWSFPIEEPPYVGSPISYNPDGSPTVPAHCTHWTPIFTPCDPTMED